MDQVGVVDLRIGREQCRQAHAVARGDAAERVAAAHGVAAAVAGFGPRFRPRFGPGPRPGGPGRAIEDLARGVGAAALRTFALVGGALVARHHRACGFLGRVGVAQRASGAGFGVREFPLDELELLLHRRVLDAVPGPLPETRLARAFPLRQPVARAAAMLRLVVLDPAFRPQVADDAGRLRTRPPLAHEEIHRAVDARLLGGGLPQVHVLGAGCGAGAYSVDGHDVVSWIRSVESRLRSGDWRLASTPRAAAAKPRAFPS